MGRPRKRGDEAAKCRFCNVELSPTDKPYSSKQAGMEGAYHWACFIEACRNRVPVSIGAFEAPVSSSGESEEREVDSAPAAAVEE